MIGARTTTGDGEGLWIVMQWTDPKRRAPVEGTRGLGGTTSEGWERNCPGEPRVGGDRCSPINDDLE
jgi:hypothetical protein